MAVNFYAKGQKHSPFRSKRPQDAKSKRDAERRKESRAYLHMQDCRAKTELETGLHKLGWVVEKFFSKDIDTLIYQPKKSSTQKAADGGTSLSRGQGLVPSPSTGSPLAGFPENQLLTRGQVMVRNSRPMEDVPTGILDQAKKWNIQVLEASEALKRVRKKLQQQMHREAQQKISPESPPNYKTLNLNTFIKVEHSNFHSPTFCELSQWPRIDPRRKDVYEDCTIQKPPHWAVFVKARADQRAKQNRPAPIRPELVFKSRATIPYPTMSSGPEAFTIRRNPSATVSKATMPYRIKRPPSATMSKAPEPFPTTSSGPEAFTIRRPPSATVRAPEPLPTTSSGPDAFSIRRPPPATMSRAPVPLPTTFSGPEDFTIMRPSSARVSKAPELLPITSSGPEDFSIRRPPSATVSRATMPYPTMSSGPEDFIIRRRPSATVSKAPELPPITSSGPEDFVIRRPPSATVNKAPEPFPTTSSGPEAFTIRRPPSATVSRATVSSGPEAFTIRRPPSATVSASNAANERLKQQVAKLAVQPAAHQKKRMSCELCHTKYENLEEHLQSEMHINMVQDKNKWMKLQTKVHQGQDFFQRLQTGGDLADPPSLPIFDFNRGQTSSAMDTNVHQLQVEPRQEFFARVPSAPAPNVKERALLPSERQSAFPKQQMVFGVSNIGSLRVLGAQRQPLPSFIQSGTSETQGTSQTHNLPTGMTKTSGLDASMAESSKMTVSQASVLEIPGTSGIQASAHGTSKIPIQQRTVMPQTSAIPISMQGIPEKLASQTTVPGKPEEAHQHDVYEYSLQEVEKGSPVQCMVHSQGTAGQPWADQMAEMEKIAEKEENLVFRDDKTGKQANMKSSQSRRAAETVTTKDLAVKVSAVAGETESTKTTISGSTLKAPTRRETPERQARRKGRPKRKASQPLTEDSIESDHWAAQMSAAPDPRCSPEDLMEQETAGDGSTKEERKTEGFSDRKTPKKQSRQKRRQRRNSGKSKLEEHAMEDDAENLEAESDQVNSAETFVVQVVVGDGNPLKDTTVENLVEVGESTRQPKSKRKGRRPSRKSIASNLKGVEAENLAAEVSVDLADPTETPMILEAVDDESTMNRTPKSSLPEETSERKSSRRRGRPRKTVSLTEDSIGTEICKAETSADPVPADSAEASVEQVATGDGSTMDGRKVEKPERKESSGRWPRGRGRRASRKLTAVELKAERMENTTAEVSAELDLTDLAKTPVVPKPAGVESTMKDQTVEDNETGERKSRRRGRPRKKKLVVVDSQVNETGMSMAEPDEADSVKPSDEQVLEEGNTETKKNEDFPEGTARGRRASRRLRAVEPEMEAVEDFAVHVAAGTEQERPCEENSVNVRSFEDKVHEGIPEKQQNKKGGRGRKRSKRRTTADLTMADPLAHVHKEESMQAISQREQTGKTSHTPSVESERGKEKEQQMPAREDSNLGSASANAQGSCAGPSLTTQPGDFAEENTIQERTQEDETADEDKEEASKKKRSKRSRKCHQKSSSRNGGEDGEGRRKSQARSSTASVPVDKTGRLARVTRQGRRQPLRETQMANQGRTRAVADLTTESIESPSISSAPVLHDVTSNSDSRRNAFMAQAAKTYPSLEKTVTNSAPEVIAVNLEDTVLSLAPTFTWNTPESIRRRTECLETLAEEAVRTENFSHTTTIPAAQLFDLYEASTSPYTEPAEYGIAFEDDHAGGKEETNSEGVSKDCSRRLAEDPTVTDASNVAMSTEHLLLQGLQMNTDEIKHPMVHEEATNPRRSACGARRGLHYDESGGLDPSLLPIAGQQFEDMSFFSSPDRLKAELPEERSVEPHDSLYSDKEHCSSATALDAQFLGRVEKGAELLMDEKNADADSRATVLENKRESIQQNTEAELMNFTNPGPQGKKRRMPLQSLSLSPFREGAQKAAKMAPACPESQKGQEQSFVNNDKRSPLKMVLVADPQRRRKSFSIRPKSFPACAQISGSLEARNSNLALQSFEETQVIKDERSMKVNLKRSSSAPAETEATATQPHQIGEQSLPETSDACTVRSVLGDTPQSCTPYLATTSTASSPNDDASQKAQQRKSQELSSTSDTASSTTSNTPSSVTSNTPSSRASNTPSSATCNTPSSASCNTPSNATGNTPSSATVNTPSSVTSNTPNSTTCNTPSNATGNTPSSVTSNTPNSTTCNTPSSASCNTPSNATGNTPSSVASNTPSSGSDPRKIHSNSSSDLAANSTQYSARMSSTGLKVVLSRSAAAKRSRHSSGSEFEPATPKQRVTNKSQKASNFSLRLDETLRDPPSSDEFAADPLTSVAARSASQKKLRKHKYRQYKKSKVKMEEGQEHMADARETEDKEELVEPDNASEVRIGEMDGGHRDIPVNTNAISVGDHGHEIKVAATQTVLGSLDDDSSSLEDFDDVHGIFQHSNTVPRRMNKSKNAVKLEQTSTSPSASSRSQTTNAHAKLSTGRQSSCQHRKNKKLNELDSSNPGMCETPTHLASVTTLKQRDMSSQADLQSNEQVMGFSRDVPIVSRHAPLPSLTHEKSGGYSSTMVARGQKRKCYDPEEPNSPKVRRVKEDPDKPSMGRPVACKDADRGLFFDQKPAASTSRVVFQDLSAKNLQSQLALPPSASVASAKLPSWKTPQKTGLARATPKFTLNYHKGKSRAKPTSRVRQANIIANQKDVQLVLVHPDKKAEVIKKSS